MADSFWDLDFGRAKAAELPQQKPQRSTWRGWLNGIGAARGWGMILLVRSPRIVLIDPQPFFLVFTNSLDLSVFRVVCQLVKSKLNEWPCRCAAREVGRRFDR